MLEEWVTFDLGYCYVHNGCDADSISSHCCEATAKSCTARGQTKQPAKKSIGCHSHQCIKNPKLLANTTNHDGLAKENLDVLSQVLVGSLRVLLRVKRDIPTAVGGKFTGDESRTLLTRKQLLNLLQGKSEGRNADQSTDFET